MLQKKINDDQGLATYCICQSKANGGMIECALCKEWFHLSCLRGGTPASNGANKGKVSLEGLGFNEGRYLCGYCCRSRRPRLETILSLLVSLQKLPVRLPEGEALQCLTERAMNWQDRARQLLATDEMTSCLNQLSNVRSTPVVGSKTISSTLASSQPAYTQQQSDSIFSGSETESQDSSTLEAPSFMMHPDPPAHPPALSNSEHAYSTGLNPSPVSAKLKNVRKSPLIPRLMNSSATTMSLPSTTSSYSGRPLLSLSSQTLARLEDLLLEGDSLEVSLDETAHFGRILQAAKAPSEPPVMAMLYSAVKTNQDDELVMDCDAETGPIKKRPGKKRRLDPSNDKPFKVTLSSIDSLMNFVVLTLSLFDFTGSQRRHQGHQASQEQHQQQKE